MTQLPMGLNRMGDGCNVVPGPLRPAFRRRRAVLMCLACVVLCRSGIPAVADDETGGLLDECVAGINANLTLIEHGEATYRLTGGSHGGNSQPWSLKVVFDYPRLRFEWRRDEVVDGQSVTVIDHSILDSEQRIHYQPPLGGLRLPNANIVMITPNLKDSYVLMDPRQQQHQTWVDPPSFAWQIAYMRKRAPDRLTAWRDEEGLIEISFQPSIEETRGIYWLSADQGYALVRAKQWSQTWGGKEPSNTYEAKFRQTSNGAFVVSYRHERDCVLEKGVLTPWRDEELWLESIDLEARPAETTFTVDGLDLPIGAPIHDQLNGREYRFGIDAVEERDIKVGQASGPMRLRSWLNIFNAAAGGALLMWLGNRIGRWSDRRQWFSRKGARRKQ